jgi:spermidine/putrescine transport system permease protein
VLGFLAAYSMFRHSPLAARTVRLLLMAPVTVSYLIIGLGLLIVLNMVGFGRSLTAVGIGHVVINLPICFSVIYSQFGDHLRNIDNAAHDLGAGDFVTMRAVIAPIMLPSIIASFCLSFTLSWDEFIISLLLSRFDVTLPVMIFELMRKGLTPEVNAAGTIVFAISIVTAMVAALMLVLRGERSQ